jgi:hypothetical protein
LLGGCAYWQQVTNSPQFVKFCEWQSVATVAIEGASIEALKDPAKVKVGNALAEAVSYLRLAASACPKAS